MPEIWEKKRPASLGESKKLTPEQNWVGDKPAE